MIRNHWIHGLICLAALAAVAPTPTSADEPAQTYRVQVQAGEKGELQPRVIVLTDKEQAAAPSKYWIGVGCEPVSDALKSQLGIRYGLVVSGVSEGQPAAAAGIRPYDVLQRFGAQELNIIEDLIAAVDKSEGKPSTVVLIRGGKQIKVEITPAERPQLATGGTDSRVRIWDLKDGKLVDPAWSKFFAFQPGILLGQAAGKQLPEGLKLTITKEGYAPLKVTVEKGDDKWTVEEGKLDELPESVRDDVKQFLGKRPLPGIVPGPRHSYQLTLPPATKAPQQPTPPTPTIRLRALQMNNDVPKNGGLKNEGLVRRELEELTRRLETLRDRLRGDDVLEEIRDELKALRRDVDELRQERKGD